MDEKSSKFPDECFFIAPIGSEGSDVRKRSDGVMTYIVSKAAEELGLNTVRADQISSPGQINLQVIERVIGARAAVADLTGLNANVFYEMAVRHTAKLPLVLIAEKGTDLPFDIAQMRTIFFDHKDLGDADHCRTQIVEHLREALDEGIVDSPISTAVDLSQLAAGGAADRSIAELVNTVEGVARYQRDIAESVDQLRMAQRTRDNVPRGLVADLFESIDILAQDSKDAADAERALDLLRHAAHYLDRRSPARTRPASFLKNPAQVNERASEEGADI